jgi:hypothetical protein
VPRHPLTRRQALKLGAAAAALAGAARPGAALGRERKATSFTLPLAAGAGAVAAGAGWRTTGVIRAPRRFDLVGLGWRRGSRLEAEVRTRTRGGRWSRWAHLHVAGDHGPDAGRAALGTDPVWTGAADELQLRLRGHAHGLEARFVRAAPAVPRIARLAAAAAPRRRAGAPAIIPRSAWGGDTLALRGETSYGQVQLAFVHHTVNANDYAPEDSAGMVLAIAKYHIDHNGWNDLGYNFLVDRYGQVFEGRAGGVELAIVGAQAQGYNSVSTGVACLGTFTDEAWTEPGLEAVAHLIGWKLSLHAVPVVGDVTVTSAGGEANRYPAGTPVTFQRISGHRDGNTTACPGDVLYGQLEDLRARAGRYATAAAGLTIRASSTTVRGADLATLSGSLRFADGSSPAGATVQILYSTGGGAPAIVASAACGADGRYSADLALHASGVVQARFAGDGARPALTSQPLDITVKPELLVEVSRTHLRRGRKLKVRGRITPDADAVTLKWERKVGRRYRRIRTRTLAVSDGRFAATMRPTRATLYRVTVKVPGARQRIYVRVS